MKRKKYDLAFGIGMACSCSESLRRAEMQYLSFPGDWTIPNWSDETHPIIEDDICYRMSTLLTPPNDFFTAENFSTKHAVSNTGKQVYFNSKTRYIFNHDFNADGDFAEELPKIADKYRRRRERLLSLISTSMRVLVLRVDRPNATKPSTAEDAKAAMKLISETYPNVAFEMLILSFERGRDISNLKEEVVSDNITRWTFDYKNPKPDALPHEIHVPMVGEFLASRFSIKDYRTKEERRAHAKAKRLARYKRVGATNVFGYHLARLKQKLFGKKCVVNEVCK